MKITHNVDDELLDRVMKAMGTTNKTKAIDFALREADRKARLISYAEEGMGMTPDELGGLFDPAYDLTVARAAEGPALYKAARSAPASRTARRAKATKIRRAGGKP